MELTGVERISRMLKRQKADRIGLSEHFWNDTIDHYVKGGHMKKGEAPETHFNLDMMASWTFSSVIDLDFKNEVLEETDIDDRRN